MSKFLITRKTNGVLTDEIVEDVNLEKLFLDDSVVVVERIAAAPEGYEICPLCGKLFSSNESGKMYCPICESSLEIVGFDKL